ncbi:MAG: hypothetical protein B9S34_10670 [Opitutia bacterium Tous-C1TDCM]|nr:MAG: hypothetical protein B9S34_10670 [Opitutae bacterium Tous-C1TDCM]
MVSLLIAGGAAALPAQTAPAAPPVTTLDPFVVLGRASDRLGAAATAAQGTVGAAELAARPLLRRGELLEVIPGVVITQHSGGGKANQYFLRGFNLDHGTDFAVGVDGVPVNLRTHAHGQGYADLNFLIPEAVRQVDYHKGPFHAEAGDFSAAGAAMFRLTDRVAVPFATLTLGENAYARFVAGGTRPAGTGATTGVLERSHEDGPWRQGDDFGRVNVYGRRLWRTDAGETRLTALAYRGTWRATDQIPARAVAAGALDRFAGVDDSGGGKTERYSLVLDQVRPGADSTVRWSAYAVRYRLDLYSNFTYFLDDPVAGDQFNQRDARTLLGGEATRTWRDAAGETELGLQVRSDLISEVGLHRTERRVRLATVRADDVDETSAGLFLRRETRWRPWLRTVAGLRADGYRFDVASDEPRNSGRTDAGIFSPKAGVVLGPWAKTELYFNAGTGFHSNDARGTVIRVDPADGVTPADRATPLVRARGAEFGIRTAARPGWVSTLSFWQLELDSELVFVGDAGATEPTGRTRRRGVEWSNFGRVTPWLVVDADLALTHARYRDDGGAGTRIANAIGTTVTAGAIVGREHGAFGALRLRYFGAQPLLEDNSVRAPASTSVNLRVGWRTATWEASIDVLNVFDRANNDIAYAYGSRLPGEPAEGVDDVHFHPAEPRMVRVTITRRF